MLDEKPRIGNESVPKIIIIDTNKCIFKLNILNLIFCYFLNADRAYSAVYFRLSVH